MSTPLKRKHVHEEDANKLDSSGSIPTKVAPKPPRYRSRLVCSEVRHEGAEPIFSSTPPLEAPRILFCVACQEDVFRVEDPFLITTADVSRAHFYTDAVRDVNVRLPDEDPIAKQPGVCGKLRKTIFGSLDAAQRWGEHHAQVWRLENCPDSWLPRATFSIKRVANIHSGAW